MRTTNIAIVSVGPYTKLAFEDRAAAMQLMDILGAAVQVTDSTWELNKHEQPHTWFLGDSDLSPELKFVSSHLFNAEETVKMAKERLDREKKDREDLEQQMNQRAEPALLAQAVPQHDNEPTESPEASAADDADSSTGEAGITEAEIFQEDQKPFKDDRDDFPF